MEIILRTVFVCSLLVASFLQEFELKPIVILFPAVYIFIYLLINKFINKLIFLPLDIITVMYFIYITGNPYLSLIFFALFPVYIKYRKETYAFVIAQLLTLIFSLYLSGYIDYILVIITIGLYISLTGTVYYLNEKDKQIGKLENNLISLTSKFVKQFNEAKKYNLSEFTGISLQNPKESLFKLFSKLNVLGISLFDIENSKCLSVGKASCDKQFLRFIEPRIYSFKYQDIWIVVVPIYKNYEISRVFFFFYKEEKLIDNKNIFYYLKVKLENELLTSLFLTGSKPIGNFMKSVNEKVLKENNNQNNN